MYKRYLLSAASLAALGCVGLSTPSLAFDDVRWNWRLNVDTDVHLDIYEWIDVDPKGATIVEIEQDFKGDAYARATMDKVDVDYGVDVTVVNSAAALGNSVSIETETSAQVHVDQDVDRDWGYGYYPDFEASASMHRVYVDAYGDAEVTNSAAAIANSFSLTVDPLCGERCSHYVGVDDMLAIVDLKQDAEGDLSAYAHMHYVDVDAYGDVDITNAAVAAGNVANITVVRGAIPFPDQD